ncbi:MAG TPA: branched-chain amino acid ABC transporter permease [Terriglobia bacterium]|nr:branched-chain amino acid ABC transporter permease [Terriglobia bacterium]
MISRSALFRTLSTPVILVLLLVVIAALAKLTGSGPFERTVTETFIRVVLVVGLYIFIGNSGVMSFGHVGFMCLSAYATAWLTIPPMMKKFSMKGLPDFLLLHQAPLIVSLVVSPLFAALFAYLVGRILMRLSGIAASIATFALLAIINVIYSNWDSVTGGTSSVVGIPMLTGIWLSLGGAVIAVMIAYAYGVSRFGLALRAAREEATAASASGVDIVKQRLIAFVVSAFVIGVAGVLYAHFLGVVNPDAFYLGLTFISLAMLVVGGMNSLSGAVLGVVVISGIIEILRSLEKGIAIGGATVAIPNGLQEIAIGVIMILILIFRPSGLTRNQELTSRGWPFRREGASKRALPPAMPEQEAYGKNH